MKMLIVVLVALLSGASPAFAEVHLSMRDGRVSLLAKDATVRQILAEWARVGHTRIVNVERIPGGPVTLVLENLTEMQALEVLLRPLSGYIAAPRAVVDATLSAYDRIIILPTLAEARPAMQASAAPPPATFPSAPPPPVFQQAAPTPQPAENDQPYEPPAATVATNSDNIGGEPAEMRPPPPNTFQKGLEVGRPMEYRSPARTPTNAGSPVPTFGGVATPGMIAPPQRGQPGQQVQPPGAPGQPVRRPGGE